MMRALTKIIVLAVLIVGGSGALYLHFTGHTVERQLAQEQEKNRALQSYIDLLQTDRRVARIIVTAQKWVGGVEKTTLLFQQYGRDNRALMPAQEFTIDGDEAHFDAEIVKFRDDLVKEKDPFRGQSIMLFVRIYGANQAPPTDFLSNAPGKIPEYYRGESAEAQTFEKSLWDNFWQLYNDKSARQAQGIRGMNGEGLWGKFAMNHIYTITLRTDGGTINEEPIDPIYKQAFEMDRVK